MMRTVQTNGWIVLSGFLLAGWVAGCLPSPAEPTPPPETTSVEPPLGPAPEGQSEPAPTADETRAANVVAITLADWVEIQEWVATQRGKVVVLDLWATTCLPCRREFPNLVQLHQALGNKVTCASVSCDFLGVEGQAPESYLPAAQKFLDQQQATFQNFMCTDAQETLLAKISLQGIPAIYVYDATGKLVRRFDHDTGTTFTYVDNVVPLVRELVGEATSP